MSSERLEEIETRLTFQEKTLSDLNDVIVRQQNQIDELRISCKHLLNRLAALSESSGTQQPEDEIPPHY